MTRQVMVLHLLHNLPDPTNHHDAPPVLQPLSSPLKSHIKILARPHPSLVPLLRVKLTTVTAPGTSWQTGIQMISPLIKSARVRIGTQSSTLKYLEC